MSSLTIEYRDRRFVLATGQRLVFGRDTACDLGLYPGDPGLSRRAGKVEADSGGWWLTNLSNKRSLHVVGAGGVAVPVPPSTRSGRASRRVVDQSRLDVLVVGEAWTHTLILRSGSAQLAAVDTGSADIAPLTEAERELVVALARGYLRPVPDYDPRPRTYQDVAKDLGLSEWQVIEGIRRVRQRLATAGVLDLEADNDPRRPVCEWLLALRLVGPDDLSRLRQRPAGDAAQHGDLRDEAGGVADTTARPSGQPGPDPGTPMSAYPTTTHPIHDEIARLAEDAARSVAPDLLRRLRLRYGEDWLVAVNRNRPTPVPQCRSPLRDFRFCLAVLAFDPATRGWVSHDCRRDAQDLNALANAAEHRRTLTRRDLDRARLLAHRIRQHFPRYEQSTRSIRAKEQR
jgi:hypothetical protein